MEEVDFERSPSIEKPKAVPAASKTKPSIKPRITTDIDPNYLSKALNLRAAPK